MSETPKLPVISAIAESGSSTVAERTEIRQPVAQFGPLPVYPQQQYIRAPASIPPVPQPPSYTLERVIPVAPVHSSPFLGDTWSQVGYQSANLPLPLPEPIIVPQAPYHTVQASTPFTPLPLQTNPAPLHTQAIHPPQSSFSLPITTPLPTTTTPLSSTSQIAPSIPSLPATPVSTSSAPVPSVFPPITSSVSFPSAPLSTSSRDIPSVSDTSPLATFVQQASTGEEKKDQHISPPSTPGSEGLVRVEEMREIDESPRILVAILVKDMEHYLPFYLQCLYNQDYDKKKLHLWIRTNNNKTEVPVKILERWIEKYGKEYAKIIYDKSDVKEKDRKSVV